MPQSPGNKNSAVWMVEEKINGWNEVKDFEADYTLGDIKIP